MKIQGSVDSVRYKQGNFLINGWFLVNGLNVFKYPLILINKKPVQIVKFLRVQRPDLSGVSDEAIQSGFSIECTNPLGMLEVPKEFSVCPEGLSESSLPIHNTSWASHGHLPFENRTWFLTFIQNPGSRVKDLETLCFLALKSLAAYRKNEVIFSAALCVVFWRGVYDNVHLIDFDRMLRYFSYVLKKLRAKPISESDTTRWRVSLLNAAAFAVAYKQGVFESEGYFQEIRDVTEQLNNTWLCVPNGITARFVLACIQHMKGLGDNTPHVAVLFEEVGAYLKNHLNDFKIVNYWCYDELLEVTRTAQQAYQVSCNLMNKHSLINKNSKFETSRISAQLLLKAFKDDLLFIR